MRTVETDLVIPDPGERLPFTGERYTTGVGGDIQNEHYHRYLFALRFCEGRDVLDVGSGEGYGSALLAQVARSVVGVDIDESSVAFAARSYMRDNLSFRTGSALALPLEDSSVDAVICFETIEHLSEHAVFLGEVTRVLRPRGILVASTPDNGVYSEAPGNQNPFHVRELNREEFLAIIRAEFSHVRMFEQQVIAGSVIAALDDASGGTESFATTDGRSVLYRPRLPRAPYLVAVASAQVVSPPRLSVLHGLATDGLATSAAVSPSEIASSSQMSHITKKVAMTLNAKITELRGELLEAKLEAARTKRLLLEMDHERGYLRAMLTSARHLTNQLRAELVHAQEAAVASDSKIDAERRLANQLRAELVHAQEAAVASDSKIDAERRLANQLRAELVHAQEAAVASDSKIDAVLRSTSWRVTRPLRGAGILVRRALRRGRQ